MCNTISPTIPPSTFLDFSLNRTAASVHKKEKNSLLITSVQRNFLSSLQVAKLSLSSLCSFQKYIRYQRDKKIYDVGPEVIYFLFLPSSTLECSSRVEVVSSSAVFVPEQLW